MPRLYSKSKNASNDAINNPFYAMSPHKVRQILQDKFAFSYGMDRVGNFQVQFMPMPCDVASHFKGVIGTPATRATSHRSFSTTRTTPSDTLL